MQHKHNAVLPAGAAVINLVQLFPHAMQHKHNAVLHR
jgi:hypothetical protein